MNNGHDDADRTGWEDLEQDVEGFDERFADWVDGRLSDRERDALEDELDRDPALREQATSYRSTVMTLRSHLCTEEPPEGIADAVMLALPGALRRRGLMPVFASAAAAAAMVMLYFVLQDMTREPAANEATALRDSTVASEDPGEEHGPELELRTARRPDGGPGAMKRTESGERFEETAGGSRKARDGDPADRSAAAKAGALKKRVAKTQQATGAEGAPPGSSRVPGAGAGAADVKGEAQDLQAGAKAGAPADKSAEGKSPEGRSSAGVPLAVREKSTADEVGRARGVVPKTDAAQNQKEEAPAPAAKPKSKARKGPGNSGYRTEAGRPVPDPAEPRRRSKAAPDQELPEATRRLLQIEKILQRSDESEELRRLARLFFAEVQGSVEERKEGPAGEGGGEGAAPAGPASPGPASPGSAAPGGPAKGASRRGGSDPKPGAKRRARVERGGRGRLASRVSPGLSPAAAPEEVSVLVLQVPGLAESKGQADILLGLRRLGYVQGLASSAGKEAGAGRETAVVEEAETGNSNEVRNNPGSRQSGRGSRPPVAMRRLADELREPPATGQRSGMGLIPAFRPLPGDQVYAVWGTRAAIQKLFTDLREIVQADGAKAAGQTVPEIAVEVRRGVLRPKAATGSDDFYLGAGNRSADQEAEKAEQAEKSEKSGTDTSARKARKGASAKDARDRRMRFLLVLRPPVPSSKK